MRLSNLSIDTLVAHWSRISSPSRARLPRFASRELQREVLARFSWQRIRSAGLLCLYIGTHGVGLLHLCGWFARRPIEAREGRCTPAFPAPRVGLGRLRLRLLIHAIFMAGFVENATSHFDLGWPLSQAGIRAHLIHVVNSLNLFAWLAAWWAFMHILTLHCTFSCRRRCENICIGASLHVGKPPKFELIIHG